MKTTTTYDSAGWEGTPGLAQAWLSLVHRWRLTVAERKRLLGSEVGRGDVAPADVAERMTLLVGVDRRLRDVPDEALRDRLRTPVLLFALDTPIEVMSGPIDDLLRFRGLVERGFGS